jgi:hypothetical protein
MLFEVIFPFQHGKLVLAETREITREACMDSLEVLRQNALIQAIAGGNTSLVQRLSMLDQTVFLPKARSTRVIHIRDRKFTSDEIYIGRPGKGMKEAPFGNPIARGRKCPVCFGIHFTNPDIVHCYQNWLCDELRKNPAYSAMVRNLAGKILVCFCKPQNVCHGDVLAPVSEFLAGL